MKRYVGFIRGINVGGNNLIRMADLRRMLEDLGCRDVKTILQSGNVVLNSCKAVRELEALLEEETARLFGIRPEFVLLDEPTFRSVLEANPFEDAAKSDPSHLLVYFAKDPVDVTAFEAVSHLNRGPERMKVAAEHLFVCYPEGIGASKLPRVPGFNKLVARSTARNWNTLDKIAAV